MTDNSTDIGDPNPSDIFGPTIDSHINVMYLIWGPIINIAIFVVLYSYRRYTFILHALIGLFACLYTLATAIPILMTTGVVTSDNTLNEDEGYTLYVHYMIGITCLSIIIASTLLGMATRILNVYSAPTNAILSIRLAHKVMGYITATLCKINSYYIFGVSPQMAGLLAQDIFFVILIIVWKFKFPRMQAYGSLQPQSDEPVKKVLSLKQLDSSKDYCMFANYIYELQPLKIWHPAGYQIIQSIKNREIDRYIYGMLASEQLPQVPLHSHSFKSLSLLGSPIAKLTIEPLFNGFEGFEAEVAIRSMRRISVSGHIYEMHLSKKQGSHFQFTRYKHINQLGRYHSITLNDEVTRLYTSVNFLITENKSFMTNFFNTSLQVGILVSIPEVKDQTNQKIILNQKDQAPTQQRIKKTNDFLPILFKTYAGGRFTDKLVSSFTHKEEVKLKISESKGEGLQFTHLNPGKIIMLAGGTGIYPFSDFIDLLFKSELKRARIDLQRQIDELSPILVNNPFNLFSFELMAAFQSLEDIHPLTLQQIIYLSRYSNKFTLTLKLKDKESLYKKLKNEAVALSQGRSPSFQSIKSFQSPQSLRSLQDSSMQKEDNKFIINEVKLDDRQSSPKAMNVSVENEFQQLPNTQTEKKNVELTEIDQKGLGLIRAYRIRLIEGGFQEHLEESINKGNISKVWICGPPKMNEGISQYLRSKYNNPGLYHII